MTDNVIWNKRQWKKIYIERLREVLSLKKAIASYNALSKIDFTIHPKIVADDELFSTRSKKIA